MAKSKTKTKKTKKHTDIIQKKFNHLYSELSQLHDYDENHSFRSRVVDILYYIDIKSDWLVPFLDVDPKLLLWAAYSSVAFRKVSYQLYEEDTEDEFTLSRVIGDMMSEFEYEGSSVAYYDVNIDPPEDSEITFYLYEWDKLPTKRIGKNLEQISKRGAIEIAGSANLDSSFPVFAKGQEI